ncbi:bifunctional abietadiene synthase, chloroplastic-like isoform X2 [Asparagus officinalis]|uniref:bifunctional abietadiene synthase, chloroplastic-like isoform X2 n=1 Tax=Asparagus officinalis TaxID=4686 RepID=UPI00098E2A4E|nr:bifunctional abietadiene synthase, chloroplastic-like isoform X2 [Asparagus officinalis]
MERISLLPSKALFSRSLGYLYPQVRGNLNFCTTGLYVEKQNKMLSFRPLVNASGALSPRVAGAFDIDVAKDSAEETRDEDDRIGTLVMQIKEMFRSMSDGDTSPSAYDTAWVARIPSKHDATRPHFPTTLNWVLGNQHEDGSWGEPSLFHLYDRLVCTLACILSLKTWSIGEQHIAKGLEFLRAHVEQLGDETSNSRTCAFEIVFPSMLDEANSIGLELPYDAPYLKKIFEMRENKKSRVPVEMMHSVHTTLLYSVEALQEIVQWKRILKLQSPDGSSLSSPAATAVAYMKTGDSKSLEYLTNIVQRFRDHERIWAIDTIERLGIHHYFREEISDALDYVYRNIGKKGVPYGTGNPIPDIDDTCMALRLARSHGYEISPDILQHFKQDNGHFICHPGETHTGVSDMFNLYRFSQISYPGETILEDAKPLLQRYLQYCIKNHVDDKWALKKDLLKEVERALRYPWKMSLQGLEAREYIDLYGENDLWIGKTVYWMHNVNNPKYLELAKLEYNRLQAIHEREINYVLKWWNNCGLDDPFVTRICPQEIYFSIAATLYEPELEDCRITYTKSNCIEDIVRDMFQNHGSNQDLKLFCKAIEQWNPSLIHSLPQRIQVIFMAMYNTLNELATEASNAQGKDVFPYFHDLRSKQVQDYMKSRLRIETKQISSWTEYFENGKKDCGVAIRTVPTMFFMGENMVDNILRCLDSRSKIQDQLSMYLRLLIDVRTHENMMHKKPTIAISSYMKEANCTEEEAICRLKRTTEEAFHELVYQYLKPSKVPRCCRRLMFEHGRITHFFLGDNSSTPLTERERISDAMDRFFSAV